MSGSATCLLVLLWLTDLVYFGLDVLYRLEVKASATDLAYQWSLETDRGHAEFFQYAKWYWCALLLTYVVYQQSWSYVCWLALFLYLALDDSLSLHERGGAWLADALNLRDLAGLRSIDLGELVISTAVGLLVFGGLLYTYVRGSQPYRRDSRALIVLALAIAIFGVVVDAAHQMVAPSGVADLLGFIEDGGEMLVLSPTVAFLFNVALRKDRSPETGARSEAPQVLGTVVP